MDRQAYVVRGECMGLQETIEVLAGTHPLQHKARPCATEHTKKIYKNMATCPK